MVAWLIIHCHTQFIIYYIYYYVFLHRFLHNADILTAVTTQPRHYWIHFATLFTPLLSLILLLSFIIYATHYFTYTLLLHYTLTLSLLTLVTHWHYHIDIDIVRHYYIFITHIIIAIITYCIIQYYYFILLFHYWYCHYAIAADIISLLPLSPLPAFAASQTLHTLNIDWFLFFRRRHCITLLSFVIFIATITFH